MNSNLQTSKPVKVVVKKKLTIRSVLNLYGMIEQLADKKKILDTLNHFYLHCAE
ncbi:hypothetical protein [Priestia flexa]|uniref:hypothetical protein n=1 Tax=Priestia flexa TaxID=86664 RepID=UPI001C97756F|nr:hypothetical protein [Priestia flexa]MBY6087369.1 hypothetical protein [Priestia flexa]